jgi:peptidyl-tRNA hydrolase ICT1
MSRFTAEEEQSFREIERWGQSFQLGHIPKNQLDFSFARSSGPGGQNVNKVSSKAQIKFLLSEADWIHPKVRQKIQKDYSRYLSANLNEFTIMSDVHRTQEANSEDCVKKIFDLIKQCCIVPGQTSAEQKNKVQKLVAAQKKKDIEFKKRLKERKQDRRGGPD